MSRGFLALVSMLAASAALAQYSESITVARYLVTIRVVDSGGAPIPDLQREDLEVLIGGHPVELESLEWQPGVLDAGKADGRLIVFFITSDFARNARRLSGQLQFNTIADDIIELFGPHDRVAVVSYDSRLKLRLDFASDKDAIRKAVGDSIAMDHVPLPAPLETGPSLARHFDEAAMRRASNAESALLLLAKALHALDGEKLVIMAGYGLGEIRGPRVVLRPEWGEAMALLQRGRVPVMALNTGMGGALSLGLVATAKDSSGMYSFTQEYPQQSVQRVAGMLAGRYELVLRTDRVFAPGQHRIGIRTGRRGVKVLAPKAIVIDAAGELDRAQTGDVVLVKPEATAHALFLEALRLLQEGESDGVEALLDDAIANDPTLAEAWYERAMLAVARDDAAAATRDLQKYLELAPKGRRSADARSMLRGLN